MHTTAYDIRRALTDVRHLLSSLGIKNAKRQYNGYIVLCPWHNERTPSCSVQLKNGEIVAHCFGCGQAGDVISFIGASLGMDLDRNFQDILQKCADIAGIHFDRLQPTSSGYAKLLSPEAHIQGANRDSDGEISAEQISDIWQRCTWASDDPDVSCWLTSRGVSPDLVDMRGLAKSLPGTLPLSWGTFRGKGWHELGYKLIIPMYDKTGIMRSLRARRVVDADDNTEDYPKCLAPVGGACRGMVMGDSCAVAMLRALTEPERVWILEGEPDYLSGCSRASKARSVAVMGIISGSWSKDIARAVPASSIVCVSVHKDAAGNKYWNEIRPTLEKKVRLLKREHLMNGEEGHLEQW